MESDHPLSQYKVFHQRKVAWGDMDAMRHVNNTKYFFYCETARIEFLKQLAPELSFAEPDNMEVGIALAETGCRFKVSLTYPDDILIGTGVTKIEENQFHLRHAIYSEQLGLIAAEATARMVVYNFSTGTRVPIEEKMLSILQAHSV